MAIKETIGADSVRRNISRAIANIETMFVGIIQSVDVANMRYNVQPILNRYDRVDDIHVESAVLYQCPMMTHKCGSFFLRAPYQIGDVVYVGVCKESIDESLAGSSIKDNKMLGVEGFRQIDGVILGGLVCDTEPRLSSDNANDFVIQNRNNGDKFVIFANGGIELLTKTKVTVDSPETECTGNLTVKGNVTVDGNITGNSNLNVTGSGTIGSVTTAKGTTLDGHTHQYNPGDNPPTSTGTGEG